MKRKDLFRSLVSKALDFGAEQGQEILELFQDKSSVSDNTVQKQSKDPNPINIQKQNSKPSSPGKRSIRKTQAKSAQEQMSGRPAEKSAGRKETRLRKANLERLKLPPGAVSPESKFLALCTGCSECIYNCPYTAILPVYREDLGKTIPTMEVNSNPCHACPDTPCISACNYDALKPIKTDAFSKLGQAKGIFEYCINEKTGEKTCEACQIACPIEKTVVFRGEKPTFAKSCIGCGLCVQSCPTFPKAIRIH
jgi:ferredoxin